VLSSLSIRLKLFLAFAAVVLVGVGSVAVFTQRATSAEFRSYMMAGSGVYLRNAAAALGDWYATSHSWSGGEAALASLQRTPDDRLVLVADSKVVADSAGQWTGRPAAGLGLDGGVPVVSQGTEVGRLYLVGVDAASGRGTMQGMGPQGMGRGPRWMGNQVESAGPANTPEDRFLTAVNQNLWQAAAIALGAALLISLLITRQITVPLRDLADGASKVAGGDLAHRIRPRSNDEIGAVTRTFNEMAETLQRQETARRNLLADIAHELRTPLTVIEGTADAILDGVYEPSPETIRSIRDEARTLARIVADLRTLSLADSGQLRLEIENVVPSELVTRAVQAAGTTAQDKGVTVTSECESDLPECRADPARIGQVLGNLLSNAIRHTPAGGSIQVTAGRADGAAEVLFAVADSGEGIDAEDLPHVFDRFFRADRSRARRSGGSGLGLAISRQLVEQHGGRIWAESTPGAGATFFFTLPIARPGARPGSQRTAAVGSPSQTVLPRTAAGH